MPFGSTSAGCAWTSFPAGSGAGKAKVSPGFVRQKASAPPRNGVIPADEETAESLIEYLRSVGSPWALPPECSPEDQQLRELAVQSPRVIQDSFIFSYFKKLRIVNRNVNEIDVHLLKFPNLEELILSTNHISKINSTNLPPTLKVLELCGNEVDSLDDLCVLPPPELQHLGLGHNCQLGSSEEKYLTDAFWPNLVSLDLSFNNFTNLLSLLSKLLTLKKLRILVLQGNPLAMLPGYRGFTIDSLPKLCALDDVNITPDERHCFMDLADNPELLGHQAEMVVAIGKIRGVPNPIDLEEPESGPEAPVITYSYYVTYEFAKGEKEEETENSKPLASQQSPFMISTLPNVESPPAGTEEGGSNDPTPVDTQIKVEPPLETANIHSTLRKPWAEIIDCEYRKEHITKDLVALKAYLLAGTTVSVVEEKVVSWPIIVTPVESPGKKGKEKAEKGKVEKGKAEKGQKDKGKEEKGKGKEEKGKGKDAGKAGNKKKKKSPSPELRSDPPIPKTLGSGIVSLRNLLVGEKLIETVCDFGVLITQSSIEPPSPKEKDSKKGAKMGAAKDKKAKAGAEGSGAARKSASPAKGKGKKGDSAAGGEVQQTQPVPLTVEFKMQHLKWESASHILINLKSSE
ncbi:leucine-rich repeat-containing protein 43-like isoform X2 [Hemicordylus capensis]|uniref:leucine-rich repeat-containing protein 43-like isoform X2 n=1 Tax=Hemicordylus capensis TaxID=884348 RepID=UPI002303EF63|nr:leucine-rich repeat-containing protein 43-like isoform X2 [Hemicordylus capensis]